MVFFGVVTVGALGSAAAPGLGCSSCDEQDRERRRRNGLIAAAVYGAATAVYVYAFRTGRRRLRDCRAAHRRHQAWQRSVPSPDRDGG